MVDNNIASCNLYLQEVKILREGIREPCNIEKKEICTLKLFWPDFPLMALSINF